ncbi:MAG: hypothetical protein EBS07_10385 [Sphingobacteriia bacterium]|nr:hypothetical protein [Sphingobacteriia bacterium]
MAQAKVNNIARALARRGLKTNRISQSTLIFKQPIVAGNSSYTFGVLQNQAPVLPGEIRLALQDIFTVSTMAIGFSATLNFAGPPAIARRIYLFSPPAQLGFRALNLFPLYEGTCKVMVNEVSYLLNWDLQRHFFAGSTQINAVGGSPNTLNELAGSKDAFFPVTPGIVLNGNAKNEFTLQMPTNQLAPALALPYANAAAENYTIDIDELVIMTRGYLAQNASTSN